MLDDSHDLALRSWVDSAQRPGGDFPIQNLPHGVFRRRGCAGPWRGGVAIGDAVLDLAAAARSGAFAASAEQALQAAGAASLNELMALGPAAWRALRTALSGALREGAPARAALQACLLPQPEIEHALPARIGDFTDFFTSWHHMLNAGRVFRPDAPPLPAFKWLPIGYHGRASTVAVSGTAVQRPSGQTCTPGAAPRFGPSAQLDHELELAVWVGPGNARGQAIPLDEAEQHVFGLGLLNDWSARDLQAWEALPLGPFLAKNFLTSVSPWIVTLAALEPFRCVLPRAPGDPPWLGPRRDPAAPDPTGFDLQLEVLLQTRAGGTREFRLSRSSFRHCHWSLAHLVAHHTEGGCALRPGDLLGTGTQSGPGAGEQGCLLELTQGGRWPLTLPDGQQRAYLEDGDTVVLRAWGEQPGAARIGFGDCRGTVVASA